MPPRTRTPSRRVFIDDGFTLIELLVVITIIAVLAGLLFLAIARGKSKAQQVQCMGNLQQMGLALQVFINENNSYPLWISPTSNADGRWWAETLERGGFGITNSAPNSYERGVWYCPSAKPRVGNMINRPYYGYNAFGVLGVGNLTNNFGLFGHLSANLETEIPIGQSEVVAPAKMIAIGESDLTAFMRNLTYDFIGGVFRHQNKVNVLFCDGHVESLTGEELFDDSGDAALVRWNRDYQAHRDRL